MLQKRAALLRDIREFFFDKNVMEVDVPVLGFSTVTDPHIQSFRTAHFFLQTSPEFYMKRLLSEGVDDIYYLGKAFRQEEIGAKHSPEFTLLEWYRLGWNEQQLIDDVLLLIQMLDKSVVPQKLSYGKAFESVVGVNPYNCSVESLKHIAQEKLDIDWQDTQINTWLDLLFTHLVEPSFKDELVVIYDFPTSQCALARLGQSECRSYPVAKRFEVYWKGIELANGYHELTDVTEQRTRFKSDNKIRKAMELPEIKVDEDLLGALDKGLPECAGVALGVDRLLMCLENKNDISTVMPFALKK